MERNQIRDALCRGLSRLENLPDIAYHTPHVAPVRITPRTPTESAIWARKHTDNFGLEPEAFAASELETLHRYLSLSYSSSTERIERLSVSLGLYALLVDLADGVQILDAFSDDVFANLGVFTQRLAQEDERSLLAWNPADENQIYGIGIEQRAGTQVLVLTPVG